MRFYQALLFSETWAAACVSGAFFFCEAVKRSVQLLSLLPTILELAKALHKNVPNARCTSSLNIYHFQDLGPAILPFLVSSLIL